MFAVLDGHGGARAAKLLANQMPSVVGKAASSSAAASDDGDAELVLPAAACMAAFAELDARILARSEADRWEDGACACVALVDGERGLLTLLQLGDCNAVLLRRESSKSTAGATELRVQSAPEAARLREAGAEVSRTGRLSGLAVSRAFGDRTHKVSWPTALLAAPEVVPVGTQQNRLDTLLHRLLLNQAQPAAPLRCWTTPGLQTVQFKSKLSTDFTCICLI